jgi:hypothetical protein
MTDVAVTVDADPEYSLAASKKGLGELYPVIYAIVEGKKEIIDGNHRIGENANWREELIPWITTREKLEAARLAVNYVRRQVNNAEVKERIELLAQTMTPEQIIELTGIKKTTVYKYYPQEKKDPAKVAAGRASAEARREKEPEPEETGSYLDKFASCMSCGAFLHKSKLEGGVCEACRVKDVVAAEPPAIEYATPSADEEAQIHDSVVLHPQLEEAPFEPKEIAPAAADAFFDAPKEIPDTHIPEETAEPENFAPEMADWIVNLRKFERMIEISIQKNMPEKGTSWREMSYEDLLMLLQDFGLKKQWHKVAAIAFMLAENAGQLSGQEPLEKTLKCECGETIPVLPDAKTMTQEIECHLNKCLCCNDQLSDDIVYDAQDIENILLKRSQIEKTLIEQLFNVAAEAHL